MNKNDKTFESSKKENLQSGALKFSSDYVSKSQLFEAVSKWIVNDKNVLRASIRPGGGDSHALDFAYDASQVKDSILHTVFKPAFKELLGADYMVGWDCGSPTYVVK